MSSSATKFNVGNVTFSVTSANTSVVQPLFVSVIVNVYVPIVSTTGLSVSAQETILGQLQLYVTSAVVELQVKVISGEAHVNSHPFAVA